MIGTVSGCRRRNEKHLGNIERLELEQKNHWFFWAMGVKKRGVEQKMLQRLCVELQPRLAGDYQPGLVTH